VKRLPFKGVLLSGKVGGVVGEQHHRNATLLDNGRVVATNRIEQMEDGEIGNEDEKVKDKD
jgi:hypothetical protein